MHGYRVAQSPGDLGIAWTEAERRCNTPVQVKGGSLAQLSGVAPLSTGYYLAQKCSKEAASLPLPLRGKSLRNGGTKFETDKTQRSCRNIDEQRAEHNIYWDCYNGYRQLAEKNSDEIELASTFEEVEQIYYHTHYSDYTDGQNARNEKNRHTERNRTTDEILKNKKTCPEESLLQIGKMEEHAFAETLFLVATEFFAELERRFGSHVHILDWALHIDESTPHIHERHVFDCENLGSPWL